MALKVNARNARDRTAVSRLLRQLCPAARVDARGNVRLVGPGPHSAVGCCCIDTLIKHPRTVTIRPMRGPIRGGPAVTATNANANLRPVVGAGPPAAGRGADSRIDIDISDNANSGYSAFGANGVRIDAPLDVVLYHEMCTGHASQNANGTRDPNDPERGPIACENGYRAAQNPPRTARVGHLAVANRPGQARGQR